LETKVLFALCERDFTEAVDELGKETRTLRKKQGTAFVFLFVADEGDELLASELRKFMHPEGAISAGVYRPFRACLSIGLPAVADQPRLGMYRPFRHKCAISKLPSGGESMLACLMSGECRHGPVRIWGNGFQKAFGATA
jgi:hypothetical protein